MGVSPREYTEHKCSRKAQFRDLMEDASAGPQDVVGRAATHCKEGVCASYRSQIPTV
jgi:hypothetical protein